MTISFKQFVNEQVLVSWKTEDASLEDAINILNARCKDGLKAIANGTLLFRGDDRPSKNIQFVDTTGSARTSRDTNNIYQLMFDASDKMKNIPSRTNSLICTTSSHYAKTYGDVDVLVPFDGSTVAYSTKVHDIFNTTVVSNVILKRIRISLLSHNIGEIIKRLGFTLPDNQFNFRDITEIDKFLTNKSPSRILTGFAGYTDIFDPGEVLKIVSRCPDDKKFTALSSAIITPEGADVSTFKYGNELTIPKAHSSTGVECWVSGKVAVIPLSIFKSIVETMIRINMPVHKRVIKSLA